MMMVGEAPSRAARKRHEAGIDNLAKIAEEQVRCDPSVRR